jgi:CRP-like cAMP-binding protein
MLARLEYRRLRPSLEPVVLHENASLFIPGDGVRHIYFPSDGVVSLVHHVDARRSMEVAMEGNEAAVGLVAYLGGLRPCSLSIVRHAGSALRIEIGELTRHADTDSRLRTLLHRSVHAVLAQVVQTGVCSHFHSVDERLARWLLMSTDRVGSRELKATQESIARMLGVRRSSITAAAIGFHERLLIDYSRGRIEILDPRRLRTASCSCYGIIKDHYDSFLGSPA